MNYFVVADPIKCIGCRTCMIACVVEHNGEDIFYQNPEGFLIKSVISLFYYNLFLSLPFLPFVRGNPTIITTQ